MGVSTIRYKPGIALNVVFAQMFIASYFTATLVVWDWICDAKQIAINDVLPAKVRSFPKLLFQVVDGVLPIIGYDEFDAHDAEFLSVSANENIDSFVVVQSADQRLSPTIGRISYEVVPIA